MLHTPTQYFTYDYTLNILRSILDTGTLERRLQDPGVCCGSAEIGGIKRETCCYPYRCCSRYIPPWGLNKHGSPLSRASPGASPFICFSYECLKLTYDIATSFVQNLEVCLVCLA